MVVAKKINNEWVLLAQNKRKWHRGYYTGYGSQQFSFKTVTVPTELHNKKIKVVLSEANPSKSRKCFLCEKSRALCKELCSRCYQFKRSLQVKEGTWNGE